MQRITKLENCIKYDHEQTQAKLDELAEALIQLKKNDLDTGKT
ncbi:EscE/YscE/SsaE family type III secretion system needle protein co-chaperone [Candidatus Regiella insecticola]|nr:EscE/YscE/SsaE family type III secretion system needle protein co-chaperone [Candidatus Regiella insecticola]